MHIRAAVSVIAASLGASVAGAGVVAPSHETESAPPLLDLASSPTWQLGDDEDRGDEGRGAAPLQAASPLSSTLTGVSPQVLFEDALLNTIGNDDDASPAAVAYSPGPLGASPARHSGIAIDEPVSVPLPPLTVPTMVTLSLAVAARRRLLPN